MVASVVNYLLYPFLSRLLSTSELGDVGIVLNVVIQAGSILLAFNLVSIYLLARHKESDARAQIEIIQSTLLRLCIYLSAATIILFPVLKHVLKIESYGSLLGMLGLLFIVVPAITWTGYIQGKKSLGILGMYNIINAVSKTFGAVLFAFLGLKATGSIFGFGIGFVVSLIALKLLSPFKLPKISFNPFSKINLASVRHVKGFVWRSIAVTTTLSIFYSVDIFSAKIILNQSDAGVYIGLSTLAGAIYFLIMTVAWIVIPNFSLSDTKHNRELVFKTIGGAALLTVAASLAFWWQGHRFVLIALGDSYAAQSSLLWMIGLSQGIIGASSMLSLFIMVRGYGSAPFISLIMCAATIGSVVTGNIADANQLIKRILIGETIGLCLVGLLLFITRGKKNE